MKISNSSLKTFWDCPLKFSEIYINGLSQKPSEAQEFGTRFHERLEAHYIGSSPVGVGYVYAAPKLEPQIEAETIAMLEAYRAAYPVEPFEMVAAEQTFEIPIPGSKHTYTGRIDMMVRDKLTKKLMVFETKTEKSGSKRNAPKAWTARTQGSLYVWAAQQIYKEPIDTIILNICTKASPKGQIGPSFRRDNLHRTPAQIAEALKDLQYVASQIDALEGKEFPANRNACVSDYGWSCEFYDAHTTGWTEELKAQQFIQIAPYSYLEM